MAGGRGAEASRTQHPWRSIMPAVAPPVAPQHTSYMTLEAGFDSEADADAGTALRAPRRLTSSPARCQNSRAVREDGVVRHARGLCSSGGPHAGVTSLRCYPVGFDAGRDVQLRRGREILQSGGQLQVGVQHCGRHLPPEFSATTAESCATRPSDGEAARDIFTVCSWGAVAPCCSGSRSWIAPALGEVRWGRPVAVDPILKSPVLGSTAHMTAVRSGPLDSTSGEGSCGAQRGGHVVYHARPCCPPPGTQPRGRRPRPPTR